MDEPTLGDALRARPPADPTYRSGLDPDRPGARRTARPPSPAPGRTGWTRAILTLGLVGVLVAGGVVVIGSSPATDPGASGSLAVPPAMANGPIAYDRDGDVWIADAHGGNARALTTGPVNDRAPSWSPDGRWIAYWHGDGADLELRAIRPDGSGDLLIASGLLEVGLVSWLVFDRVADQPLLTYVLRQTDLVAGVEPVILRAIIGRDRPPEPVVLPGTAPAWSADGTTLAYLTGRTNGQLTLFSADTGTITWQWPAEIVGGPTASGAPPYQHAGLPVADPPTWSPDGARLALAAGVTGDRDIVVREGRGIGARWSTPSDEWSPAWSPDGRQLAWLRRDPLRTVIQVADADGSRQSSPLQVDDNATKIVGAPDGSGWLVVRPGAIDMVPDANRQDAPPFSIDAPLSSGIVSWLAVPTDG